MEKLDNEKLKTFLNSSLDEAEYFGYSNEDTISLKEYLEMLKLRYRECEQKTSPIREKIIAKHKWIKNFMYYEDTNEIVLDGKVAIFLSKNEKSGIYEPKEYGLGKDVFAKFKYLDAKDIGKKHTEELDELAKEIKKYINGELYVKSVSNNFGLNNYYELSRLAHNIGHYTLAYIERDSLDITLPSVRSDLSIEETEKLTKKIRIKKMNRRN